MRWRSQKESSKELFYRRAGIPSRGKIKNLLLIQWKQSMWGQELSWIWTGTTERCGRERERKTQTCYLWRSLWVRLHVEEDQPAVHLHCLGRKQRLKTLRVFPLINTKPQVIEELTTSMKTIIIRTRTSTGSVPRNYKKGTGGFWLTMGIYLSQCSLLKLH